MSYTNPTVADFKNYFVRDFPYGTDPETSILNADIERAMAETEATINTGLFSSQAIYNVGYYNLTAHFLVLNIRASSQGIAGQFAWLQTSKSVGSVSESLSIPQRILDNPEYAWLTKTNYGTKYLMMILPQLTGQMFVVCGGTRA